ncbi:vomeronasal type-2 receptor 116-like [Dipodomys spectabilis]|uniref:vomeronasal type-2 receptor 116-like n=1 Tax=Dipodomys spectabilis TaxID=105255 RepID=UPI001C5447BD|nr:vomeronasal type-2 receptor 116-like [Dipodomys spectabilis]
MTLPLSRPITGLLATSYSSPSSVFAVPCCSWPTQYSHLHPAAIGIVFTVAVSPVLAKTVTVVLAFKATSPGRRMRWLLVSGAPNFIIHICTLIQVTLCGLWLGTSPPFVDTDAHSEHGHIIILCNKGPLTTFYCVLGYLGSLALSSFTMAFLLPVLVRSLAGTSCFSPMKHGAHMDGDVMIAGFFPLYTLGIDLSNSEASRLIFKTYQLVMALSFAIEEINKNSELLHNLTLGFDIYDIYFEGWAVLKNPFIWLFGKYKIPNYSCRRDSKSIAALTGPLGITSVCIGTLLELYRFPQLHLFIKNIQFYNPAGEEMILDEKRKLESEYDILNIWNFPEGLQLTVKVGKFSPYALHGNQLSLSEDMVEWAIRTTETPHSACSESCGPGFRKSPQEEKATCCFDCNLCPENEIANGTDMDQCVKCPDHQYANTQRTQCLLRAASFLAFGDPLGMALACMALCFSMLTAVVLGMFVKHHDTAIVKANNRTLSYILLISLIFCFFCSLLFLGRPNTVTCILQQIAFGIVFTMAISTVLAKTVTVVLAFKATSPGRWMRWLLVSGAPNFIIPICTLIQVTLCGLWLGISPPFVDTDAHSEHGHVIILCNKGSLTAFYCVLGYLGFLALSSFTMAFLARNLPDTFNEAKFLTFSMLVFRSAWVTFLPVYHSAKGKVMVVVEVSILASGAGLLGCIFAPKCYNILFMPNRSSLHGFRDKRHSRRNKPS